MVLCVRVRVYSFFYFLPGRLMYAITVRKKSKEESR